MIKPITPVKLFPAVDVEQSFRFMQKGTHIGKIVVVMPRSLRDIPRAPSLPTIEFKPNACYFLAGGLGGLGRSITTWMVENGAREFIYISRSAGKKENDQSFFRAKLEGGYDWLHWPQWFNKFMYHNASLMQRSSRL